MLVLPYLIGILVSVFIVYLTVEFVWQAPRGTLAQASQTEEKKKPGLRGMLAPLDAPVEKYAPPVLLREAAANLYWAQLNGAWQDWNAVQFAALQLAAAAAGFVFGMVLIGDLVPALVAVFLGWNFPAMSLKSSARRARRQFVSQLPEFLQLISAQMAAGVSLAEALNRVSKSPSLVGQWMRMVIQGAQGRDLVGRIKHESQLSLLPELISVGTQLEIITRGTAQKELMAQLAMRISADYIGQAEQRAEKLGSELIFPMILFYFVPFLGSLLSVIAYPLIGGIFGAH